MHMTFTHPCPITGCNATLEGVANLLLDVGERNADHIPVSLTPTFPVTWSDETNAHLETHR